MQNLIPPSALKYNCFRKMFISEAQKEEVSEERRSFFEVLIFFSRHFL